MITEAGNTATLEVSIVLHESALDTLDATLRSLALSVVTARKAGVLGRALLRLTDNASSADYRAALAACLQSLENEGLLATAENPDGASETAAALCLHYLALDENLGFGAGHNRALLRATPEPDAASWLFLILNPDVELAPDALQQALGYFASHSGVAAANPRCWGRHGGQEFLCKRYPSVVDLFLRGFGGAGLRRRYALRLARYEYRDLTDDAVQVVEMLSGACLLCRAADFHRLDGFDPEYFMYFEDFDLSLRLAESGSLVYLPQMQIVHHGGYAARKGWRHVRWFLASALRFFHSRGWKLA